MAFGVAQMLSLDVPLKLSGYDISVRKSGSGAFGISAREDTLQSEFAEHPVKLNCDIDTTV